MTGTVLEVEHLSKRYRLGELVGRRSIGEAVNSWVRRSERRRAREEIWALRDVTFSVAEGQTIGVIGRNGAGKSTLLKILSRITEPTEGVARTRGRVGALLEVGTGFHPELTGRENVYLNGALLGMTRHDIDARFDDIVEFAGVARFLDTPIKRYSSGMYLRLAFAVAAHVEPDIMIVDEVLAVGDAEFQQRCLGRMASLEREGRTVVFVSHDLAAIARLCPTAVWLDHGEVQQIGPTAEVVGAYLRGTGRTAVGSADLGRGLRGGPVTLLAVRVLDREGRPTERVDRGDEIVVEVEYDLHERVPGFDVSVKVTNAAGVRVLDESWSDAQTDGRDEPGRRRARLTIPGVLNVGDHVIGLWIGTRYETFVDSSSLVTVSVVGEDLDRPSRAVCLDLPWSVEALDADRA
jgi:ABC-2 type transport system ATP-binding protein/lipopolysaccharide transport system ATP-binding protein